MGCQSQETAKMIVKELDLPMTADEFIAQSKEQFQALFPDAQLMPG